MLFQEVLVDNEVIKLDTSKLFYLGEGVGLSISILVADRTGLSTLLLLIKNSERLHLLNVSLYKNICKDFENRYLI